MDFREDYVSTLGLFTMGYRLTLLLSPDKAVPGLQVTNPTSRVMPKGLGYPRTRASPPTSPGSPTPPRKLRNKSSYRKRKRRDNDEEM